MQPAADIEQSAYHRKRRQQLAQFLPEFKAFGRPGITDGL
jgi:hypothetical protein